MRAFARRLTEYGQMIEQVMCRIEALERSIAGTTPAQVIEDVDVASDAKPEVWSGEDGDTKLGSVSNSHELGESVWVAPFVVFGCTVDWWSKTTIAVGFVLNLVIQWCFSAVAFSSFGAVDLPEVGAMSRWRFGVGHLKDWSDPVTSASLVGRVCGGDDSLAFANEQHAVVLKIDEYSQNLDLLLTTVHLTQGSVLSVLASTLWSLVVCSDLKKCVSLLLAFFPCTTRGGRMALWGPLFASENRAGSS